MNAHHENFEAWYGSVLEGLYDTRSAGIAIAMIAFPLLERYVRQKIGLPAHKDLTPAFQDEVARLIPGFHGAQAQQFWTVYRHGLLHQVTLNRETRAGTALPPCALTHDIEQIFAVAEAGVIVMHPVRFAQRVLEVIRGDFATYVGQAHIGPPLPEVRPMTICGRSNQQPATVSTTPLTILGTSTGP